MEYTGRQLMGFVFLIWCNLVGFYFGNSYMIYMQASFLRGFMRLIRDYWLVIFLNRIIALSLRCVLT